MNLALFTRRTAVFIGAMHLAACSKSPAGSPSAIGSSASGPKCGSAPTQIVDLSALGGGSLYAVELAIDATNVYFSYENVLMSVPIRGGSVRTLARLPQDPDSILVTRSYIVFADRTGNEFNETLMSVPIAGGSPITLASSSTVFGGVAADDQTVYFIDQDGTKSIPVAGGNVEVITTQVTSANAGGRIAIVGGNLIVAGFTTQTVSVGGNTLTLQTGEGSIESIPIHGGAPTTLATGQPNASFPLACGPDICWWTGATPNGPVGTTGPGSIARLAPDGGITTLPNAPYSPASFTFDGTDFFETVGCDLCSGTLLRIPGSGAPVVTIGEGWFATVDDECVYFSVAEGHFPSADGGILLSGIFSLEKSYVPPSAPTNDAEPAGSVLCSQAMGPVEAGATVVGPTAWCTPPYGCEPFNGQWACCFYDSIGSTNCDLIGDASALIDTVSNDSE